MNAVKKLIPAFKKKKTDSSDSADEMKKKAMVCSTEAAAISIAVHVLLILFAGSIVAIKYVQKRDAEFQGQNVARPKLERRQLEMPVKVKNLQKKSRRPKVTTRMASVSTAAFSLPDMSGLSDIDGGFDRSGGRSMTSMGSAGSLGFGISKINFFGARAKGEKVVFILDAGKKMVEDHKGGYFTYPFAKDKLAEMMDRLRGATLFNVMVYNPDESVMFSDKLIPATPENVAAVKEWITPLNKDPYVVADLTDLPRQYTPPRKYEMNEIDELHEWMRPVQAAMEQKADTIFVLCSGFGELKVSEETVMRIHGIESKKQWLEGKGWTTEKIRAYQREVGALNKRASAELKKINARRKAEGKPLKIINSMFGFIHRELKWEYPQVPPILIQLVRHGRYQPDWLVDYFKLVYEFNYIPNKLPEPSINFVKLIASDGRPYEPPYKDKNIWNYNSLKRFAKGWDGRFEHLRGAKTIKELYEYNDLTVE